MHPENPRAVHGTIFDKLSACQQMSIQCTTCWRDWHHKLVNCIQSFVPRKGTCQEISHCINWIANCIMLTLELAQRVEDDAADIEIQPHAHGVRCHQHLPWQHAELNQDCRAYQCLCCFCPALFSSAQQTLLVSGRRSHGVFTEDRLTAAIWQLPARVALGSGINGQAHQPFELTMKRN